MELEFEYPTRLIAWSELIDKHPECGNYLLRIAKEMRKAKSEQIPLPSGIEPRNVSAAEALKIIILDGENVSFSDNASFLYFLASATAQERFNEFCNTRIFWDEIRDLYGEYIDFKPLRHHASMLLVVLSNQFNMNVCSSFTTMASGNRDSQTDLWTLLHVVEQALPYLHETASDVVDLLRQTYPLIMNDLGAGSLFNAIERLSSKRVAFGRQLLEALVDQPEWEVIQFLEPILVGIAAQSGVRQIYETTFGLIQSEQKTLVPVGIGACARFRYDGKTEDLKNRTLSVYRTYLKGEEQDAGILCALARGYGMLLPVDSSCKEAICELSQRTIPEVQYSVVGVLLANLKGFYHEDWYRESLMHLAQVDPVHQGITRELDFVLCELVKHCPSVVMKFLELWIEKHPSPGKELSIVDVFDSLFHVLITAYKESLEFYITKWFNSDDAKFHHNIQAVVSYSSVHNVIYCLSQDYLSGLTVQDVKYVNAKILGYVFDYENLCHLVFSLLRRTPENETVNQIVQSSFIAYVAYNFPGYSLEFLKGKISEGTVTEQRVARAIFEEINKYQEALSRLPRIKEFMPPENRVEKYEKMKHKVFSHQMQRDVKQKSVFLQLVRTVTLKGGRASFSKVNGIYTPKSVLVEQSVSMEVPRGEYTDPIGQAMDRVVWRAYKREDSRK